MSATLIRDIKLLVNTPETDTCLRGKELAVLPVIENAYLILEDEMITGMGRMAELMYPEKHFKSVIRANGQIVLPAWCDSHTHIVFAATREEEFIYKLKGMSYAEIAAKGGGILNSARKMGEASEAALFNEAWKRLEEVSKMGTGSIEIKSGYGLTVESELKMLRVIKQLKEKSALTIKATFLGAHTYPTAFKDDHEGYIRQIIDEMLPVIARDKLADYIDVFCETGFFSKEETIRICKAGMALGLKPKIHANQLNLSGGTEAGVELGALTVDHLETMDADTIRLLAGSSTIGTLLPTAAYFLRMPYQPARL
ncbi:MAG TPA: imidazolonepropionase [Chitinophagaceae bacterium]|nr:imidazolonepropionase [Chitinophagaceae bacterium]